MDKSNKVKYDMDFRKENKKQFNVDLNIWESEELTILLKKAGVTKTQFLRNAIDNLRKEIDKKNDQDKIS